MRQLSSIFIFQPKKTFWGGGGGGNDIIIVSIVFEMPPWQSFGRLAAIEHRGPLTSCVHLRMAPKMGWVSKGPFRCCESGGGGGTRMTFKGGGGGVAPGIFRRRKFRIGFCFAQWPEREISHATKIFYPRRFLHDLNLNPKPQAHLPFVAEHSES